MSVRVPAVRRVSGAGRSGIVFLLSAVAVALVIAVAFLLASDRLFNDEPKTPKERDYELLAQRSQANPKDAMALAVLADTEYELGKKDDALRHAADALKNAGSTVNIRLIYAGILMREGRFAEAAKLADEEIALPSANSEADAYFLRAQAEWELKDREGALKSMSTGLARDPVAADARILHADMLRQSGRKAEAIAEYERALKFLPNDARAVKALAGLGVKAPAAAPSPHSAQTSASAAD